ncbi:hypothetical protein CRM22_005755, partial [Opisthorchis felineus]
AFNFNPNRLNLSSRLSRQSDNVVPSLIISYLVIIMFSLFYLPLFCSTVRYVRMTSIDTLHTSYEMN